ncbi:acyl transferase/acyl hydrolase/lysophospholipase [Lucifera butyrica]|uniref:Acyl transferase/acyl hydrolase/lysophospholipase n=1 Tax=Lucifera butyrica TaxID=1351585 RepID=A0A498R956_9FIRM|nr:patatin-like phospholipase family protein [Lucifera butyrica]VBB05668.1 acyl transferase/acyl hydrolase/lysophospholipase [Lucifera butyrica]
MRPKIGLALGSGGLRGLVHVGVLNVLEREKIPVDYIAGCSIGSLIGALYASGLNTETIVKLAKNLKRRHWLDFSIPKMGIVAGERILEMMRLLTRQKSFAELTIPLAVVATELNHGREIIFTEGNVAQAVRASISVPGIFIPFELDGMLLVDGAVLNPTPMDAVRKMGADIVIAVDLAHAGTVCNITNMFDVIIQSIDIMERELLKQRQECCDVLLQPDVAHISPSSFEAIDECLEIGERVAEAALPQIKYLLESTECRQESGESPNPRYASPG